VHAERTRSGERIERVGEDERIPRYGHGRDELAEHMTGVHGVAPEHIVGLRREQLEGAHDAMASQTELAQHLVIHHGAKAMDLIRLNHKETYERVRQAHAESSPRMMSDLSPAAKVGSAAFGAWLGAGAVQMKPGERAWDRTIWSRKGRAARKAARDPKK
jgi:hypothetical protein